MYLFPLTNYVRISLTDIFRLVRVSVFDELKVDLTIDAGITEKITDNDQINALGMSSDFLNSNLETFIFLFISYAILLLMYYLSKKLPENNLIRLYLIKINFKVALLGQYMAIMNNFVLNFPLIRHQSYHDCFA
jgi:hypothetical protein